MNQAKINKLRRDIEKLRRKGGIKRRELNRLARAVGRELSPRGKEPTWVDEELFPSRPLSIPGQSSDINRFTAMGILDELERDLDELEARAEREQGGGRNGRD